MEQPGHLRPEGRDVTVRDDRSSALLVALPFGRLFPETDGALEALDRQQLALLYRPIPAGSGIPQTPTEVVNDPGHVAIFTETGLKRVLEHGFRDVRIIDAGRTFVGVCHGPKF